MTTLSKRDTPFPLKRYYLVYGGSGSVIFYVILFMLIISAERQALYDEYIHGVTQKAKSMYLDIERDFLKPNDISIEQADLVGPDLRKGLREEIEEIVKMDFSVVKLKLFRVDGMTIYDHTNPENEGLLYPKRGDSGFISATQGKIKSNIEVESDGRRLMEAYLPIKRNGTGVVIAVLETYEDVSRFEDQVKKVLKDALLLPTIVFIIFNIVLYLIVAKADKIITENTNLLVTIRKNMEKYLSQSAITAIYHAVSEKKEIFQGKRQSIVILFSDIRGFTSYSESTEPENVVQNLNRIFQIQAEIIHKYGGVIDKFVGDELMVMFEEGKEIEAVKASIEILEAIYSNPEVKLKIGIGIHSGEAVVGSIGTEHRRDYTAIGDTVNIGARLCGACPADSVYVSADVFKSLPLEIQSNLSAHKTLELKGKAEPVSVNIYIR
jgi:class 3 adenylate cyclase